MSLRLDELPDRETVKITFAATSELSGQLNDYAQIYQRTYGKTESVAELIPYMLRAFMAQDAGFRKPWCAARDPRA